MFRNPPEVNGVMTLTEEEILAIKTKLETIQSEFTPTEEEPVLAIHGLVARYNQANPDFLINGDTAEFILN